ncbi:MAG: hypothetical protein JNL53_06720 [Cyclobacteriaceae bacterium]|nr:hypothetical protein [Cyclobacteriaceae bacterium]
MKTAANLIHVTIHSLLNLTFCVNLAWAQEYVDVLKLNYNNTVRNTFADSEVASRIMEVDLETTIPIVLNSRTNFITGFIFERIETQLFEDGVTENFGSFNLKIGINKIHSEKWSGTYIIVPKIASDLNQISHKDFQLGGYALLKYKKSSNTSYKVGVYSNSELFGPWVVPLFGIYYLSPSKRFEANVTVPVLADFNYSLHPKFIVGFNYAGMVRTYHLTGITSTGKDGYVERATNEVAGYLKLNLTKRLGLLSKFGHSIGRHYRVYDEDDKITIGFPLVNVGDDRQQLNTDIRDGWVYQFVLLYRFHKE